MLKAFLHDMWPALLAAVALSQAVFWTLLVWAWHWNDSELIAGGVILALALGFICSLTWLAVKRP